MVFEGFSINLCKVIHLLYYVCGYIEYLQFYSGLFMCCSKDTQKDQREPNHKNRSNPEGFQEHFETRVLARQRPQKTRCTPHTHTNRLSTQNQKTRKAQARLSKKIKNMCLQVYLPVYILFLWGSTVYSLFFKATPRPSEATYRRRVLSPLTPGGARGRGKSGRHWAVEILVPWALRLFFFF